MIASAAHLLCHRPDPAGNRGVAAARRGRRALLNFTFDAAQPTRISAPVQAGLSAGSYDVIIRDGTSCASVLPNAVKIIDAPTLTVSAASPAFGAINRDTP